MFISSLYILFTYYTLLLATLQQSFVRIIHAVKAVAIRGSAPSCDGHSIHGSPDQTLANGIPFKPASRLPEIPLPSFKGDFHYWPTFRDRFSALVGDRTDIPKIDKMQHLIGCLQGPTADAVRNIPVSADNYDLAWSTLSSRFHRPRLVANALIDKLISAPVLSQETCHDLGNFVSTSSESISLLNALNIDDLGSFILFSLVFRCLPTSTRKLFESSTHPEFPSVKDLLEFAQSRVTVLEIAGDYQRKSNHRTQSAPNANVSLKKIPFKQPTTSLVISKSSSSKNESCSHCRGKHSIAECRKFASLSAEDRHHWARSKGVCFMCLSSSHWSNKCTSRIRCDTCSKRHHTLLHGFSTQRKSDSTSSTSDASLCAAAMPARTDEALAVLLGTALVHVRDHCGTWQTVRALVDSASQISAITSSCSTRLGLRPKNWTAPISGLSGTTVTDIKGTVDCIVQPRFAKEPQLQIKEWVLSSITSNMPRQSVATNVKDRFANLALADPTFNIAAPVDMLLGADVFSQILDGRKVSVDAAMPTAFSSIFGWILIGPVLQPDSASRTSLPVSLTVSVENLIEKFWRIEEPAMPPPSFTEDGRCEEIFVSEHQRLQSGRFSVPLPTRAAVASLSFPGSREHAIKRFENLEQRLSSDSKLNTLYSNFMTEYLTLGHMSVARTPGSYFIPHHAVYRPADGDSKIRVVFDASARGSRGPSLNDCFLQSPKLQQDIVDVLTRFRVPERVFTADICKMYWSYRYIVHSNIYSGAHPLTKSSPTLRVLQSIALNDCAESDAVRDALLNQTYVDDVCAGADSTPDVLRLQADLVAILGRAGLELKKWSSNEPTILDAVPVDHRVSCPPPFDTEDDSGVKVLGIQWHPTDDYFSCALRLSSPVTHTKRGLLSVIARIYDPLGLVAPATFLGKCIMQRTWSVNISWDDPLPTEISRDWESFVLDLPSLSNLKVPRHFNSHRGAPCVLLGFCDASTQGYAAVLYIKMLNRASGPTVFLVGTKTKLAPIKSLSIPHLELNAALLLARWMNRIRAILEPQLNIIDLYAWSDSAIVLSWLNNPHSIFKVYVSNRAHQISILVPGCRWLHVRSEENPADCASRGVLPSVLFNLSLYWQGPQIMTALITRDFWIVSIKSVLFSITRACPVCVRFDAKPPQPIMTDLPAVRVQQSRPFARVGVDYAGPLQMRETSLRKARTYKVYIAVFVCFSVKAVHLELVTELSTDAFLAAFDRFVARRGLPSDIFSDCGTNFVGADKQLQLLVNSPAGQSAISEGRSSCQWHFNLPGAPHFGGIWEAAVRSTKRLLIRTMGTHVLTYEEFSTLLTRIDAVLNSRPLTPLTSDPADLDYLSPGHFLIGQPLLAVPPRVTVDSRINLSQRWKLLDQCHQAFWRRWSMEYLTSLQGRPKWTTETPNIKVNDMVIIIDKQSPPLTWRLGRVIELLPGDDGVVRVARLSTLLGTILRPVAKLVVLPTQ